MLTSGLNNRNSSPAKHGNSELQCGWWGAWTGGR